MLTGFQLNTQAKPRHDGTPGALLLRVSRASLVRRGPARGVSRSGRDGDAHETLQDALGREEASSKALHVAETTSQEAAWI